LANAYTHADMENSTYIIVPNAGGHQLQLSAATSSAGVAATLPRANSGHAVAMSSVNSAHVANLTAGKSLLNVRNVAPHVAGGWKPADSVNRQMSTQTRPVRLIVASSKDGFVNVPSFAPLPSGGGTQAAAAAVNLNTAAANNNRVTFVKQSGAGVAQKIAPAAAAANFMTPVANGSLRAVIPGGNKVPVRTVPVASFANSPAAVVPKTVGTPGAVWGSLSVTSTTMASNSAAVTSPSKQVIIQLAPEQLSVRCASFLLFGVNVIATDAWSDFRDNQKLFF